MDRDKIERQLCQMNYRANDDTWIYKVLWDFMEVSRCPFHNGKLQVQIKETKPFSISSSGRKLRYLGRTVVIA